MRGFVDDDSDDSEFSSEETDGSSETSPTDDDSKSGNWLDRRSALQKAALFGGTVVTGALGYVGIADYAFENQETGQTEVDFSNLDAYDNQVMSVNADNVVDVAEYNDRDLGELSSILEDEGEDNVDLGFYADEESDVYRVGVFDEGQSNSVEVNQDQYVSAQLSARSADDVNDFLTGGDNQ